MKGKVKWFNNKLGYGFIEYINSERDIFVRFSEIKVLGYKFLKEGDIVDFDFDEDNWKATNVKVIKKASYLLKEKNEFKKNSTDWR